MSQQYLLNWQRPKSVAIQQKPNIQQRNALIYSQNISTEKGNVIISTTSKPNLSVTGDFNMRKLLDPISFNVTYNNNTNYNLSISGKNNNGSFFGGGTNIVGPDQSCVLQCTPEFNTISASLYDNSVPTPIAIAAGGISVGQTAGLGCGLGAWGPWTPIFQLDLNINGNDNGSPSAAENYWWNVLPWTAPPGNNFSNIILNYNQISDPAPPCPANAVFKFINNSASDITFIDPINGGNTQTIEAGNTNFGYSIANFASGINNVCYLSLALGVNQAWGLITLGSNINIIIKAYTSDITIPYTNMSMTSSDPLLNINLVDPYTEDPYGSDGAYWNGVEVDPSIGPGWTASTTFIVTFADVNPTPS
jgi:hypothetical protein